MLNILSRRETVLVRRLVAAIQKWRNVASRGQKYLYLVVGKRYLRLRWCPWDGGYAAEAEGLVACFPALTHHYPRPKEISMKRREALGLKGVPMPGPNAASILLGKLPAIREFLSCTEYEDRTARTVGALRITSRGTTWMLTLTDPDARARLCVSDASLDKALMLMEQLLGVAECPWEADPYAEEREAKKRKK